MASTSTGGEGADCPLLHLDHVSLATLVGLLPEDQRRMLRLASKVTQRMVDKWTRKLSIGSAELQQRHGDVQARFCVLAQLVVIGPWPVGHEAVHMLKLSQDSQPWSSITSLTFKHFWPPPHPSYVAPWPMVRQLIIDRPRPGWLRRDAEPLSALCQQLPHLTSLQVMDDAWEPCLGDQELKALAALPALTALIAHASITEVGWAAIISMCAVRSLRLCVKQQPPPLDLQDMTALTDLFLVVSEPASALQVQLPASLVSLRLDHLSDSTLPALSQLTYLALCKETAGEPLLKLLASQCRRLARLEVDQLALSGSCYSTPMPAVTQLTADSGAVGDAAGVKYRHVFPSLRALSIAGLRGRAKWWARWEGCMALNRLDLSSRFDAMGRKQNGWELRSLECRALAMLPAFTSLRLDVTVDNVRRLGRLTALQSLELVWALGLCYEVECQAFVQFDAPPQLQSVSVSASGRCRVRVETWAWPVYRWRKMQAQDLLPAVAWLATASRLIHVHWVVEQPSDIPVELLRLAAAAHFSMRRFRADGDGQRWVAMTPY